jgi:predicted nuclease of predicted toxin-antitoxin system
VSVRILCDENDPVATVGALDDRGVTATHVTDDPGAGTDDEGVARYASDAEALLLTNDDDFLDPYRLARRVATVLDMIRSVEDLPERVFLTATYDERR